MKKLWLCFWVGDGSDRESYSTYYSTLVEAKTKEEALEIYLASDEKFANGDINDYDAIEMKIIK